MTEQKSVGYPILLFFSISNVSVVEKLSYQNQQTIAIVDCSENYENLKTCCHPLFEQINSIFSKQKWNISGKDLNVDYFVSADMKFIQLLLGLGGSTGEYACPWCKVDKKGRSDLSVPWDFYHQSDMKRTIDEMLTICSVLKNEFGCKHKPLLKLRVDHFIPDELHLMLRITDVLIRNLIDDARELGADLKVKREVPVHFEKLTELI